MRSGSKHWSIRMFAAFLAFVMLLGNVPTNVFATEITGEERQETSAPVPDETDPAESFTEPETETPGEVAAGSVDVCVNPLYADVITEEMVRGSGQQIPSVMTFSEPEYVGYANALELLREQLALRAESTTLYICSETRLSSSYYVDLFYSAMEHTGNPKQGDYLRCNVGGCEFLNLTEQLEDGVYYYTATFLPAWFTTAEMEEEMDAAVDSLLTQLNLWDKTDYQKIRGVYDYICGNIKYDYDTLDDDSYKLKYTAYAALVNKTAVCQGFATLFYRLMLELGVDCRYISGWAGDENHGWNIVRLDDVYYNVDATWDAGLTVYYRYFLCTPDNFPDHTRSSEFSTAAFMSQYPMATVPYVLNVQASGTLNNGMKWVLDGDTGILTVSGTGAMPNWGSLDAPWYPYAESIRGAVLTEGITSVGDSAFHRCKNMTLVQLPGTLTRIGKYGFDNCRSLKQIELPEGLTTIASNGFSECTALKEIVIPSTVTSFGSSVFANCYYLTKVTFAEGMKSIPSSMFFNSDSLKSVVFPSTLTEIGSTAFRMCDSLTEVTLPAGLVTLGTAAFADCTKLKNIYVEDGNTRFMSKNGVLFSKDGKTLWCFPAARTGTYTIPDGTVTIGNAAFGSARISNVIFPDSVKTIDTYGFARSWLREVVVGEGVEYVGDTAFGLCDYLTKVTFGKALKEIDSAFSYYRGSVLREVVFTGDAPKFDSYAFYTTTVTAYYPSNNPTWTASVRQNYRGTVTWKGMHVCAYDAVVTAPTCTEPGYTTHTCTCGDSYVDSYTAPLGHSYEAVVTAPTCTEQGYTTHTCECGDKYVDSYVDALGHNYEGVYCVRCGDKNPDLTDCPENPVSTEWPRVNTDLSHIICYGQSFSVGADAPVYPDPAVDGVYVYGSLTNSSNGKALTPLATTGNQHAIISAGNVLARLLAEGGYNTDLVLGSYGSGGRTIAQLMSKERQQQIKAEEGYTYDCLSSGRYEVFETSVDALAEFADNSGKSISCPVIVYLQGETDQNTDAQLGYPDNPNRAGYGAGGDKEKYKQYMTRLKEDMQSKVMEAYGQTEKPLFVIYQVSGTYVRTQYSSINMAQIEFAQEHEDVILVQTPYFTSHYTGTHHLSQNGYRWLGEYIGRYVHTALTQRVKPWPMLPEKFEILSENTIRIRVSGAENGLSIDTYTVENATNSKNRYGFNILVDGTNVVPKTVEVSGSEIILTMPDGAASLLDAQTVYVQYAGQKAQGTGNIRDNCTALGFYEYLDDSNDTGTDKKQSVSYSSLDEDGNSIIGKKYPLYNWLASFSYRVNTNDLHVHNYVETVIAPTCSTRGYTAYACACGDAYAGEFVDATGIHTYEAVVTEPTCTEGGYTTYICTCGDVREITDHTDPLGHKEVVDARVLHTAGKTGLTEGSHCAACGEILKAQEVIPAAGYEKALEDGAFKVLLVGNTFSEDAANYGYGMTNSQLLGILQGMLGEEVQVTVGLIHYGASSLAWHATQAHQNTSRYAFRVIDSKKGKWETVGTVSSAAALQWADWDAVVLQPFSVEAISGKANPIHADQEDAQFYPLENSTSYMLDHVNRYAPDAEIYCFMHWQRYNLIKLNVGLSQHNTMADFFPVVMDYRGSESGARYDEIIPVGTAVQNARTTYLSLLSYNTEGKVTLKEDPQFGLQRDVNHLSLNVGRYIAALTFAETLIPEEIRAEGYAIPDIRNTESVGRLPKEYTTLGQKAAQAAVNSWKNNSSLAVTEIEGYREDPTVAAAEKLAAAMLEIPCALDVADLQNRIAAAALEELPEDFDVDAVALAEGFVLNAEGQNFTATVTIRFGYTSKAVTVGVTVGGHDYEAVVTPPTCIEQGFTTHTCYCGDSYIDSYVAATGHKFGEWEVVNEPTCTEIGEERRDCDNCDHYETREVEAIGHDYGAVVSVPTCTEKGFTTHTCSKCGDSYVDSYVDATGHKFGDWTVTTEPTCTEVGEERRDCANCEHFETREIEATGHDYEVVVTAPTCTAQGFTTHTCSKCGDTYKDSYVEATGHAFGDWTVTTEPTCTEKGMERRDCANCDHFETREVEATGHDYEAVVTVPTCTEKGYTTHTCSACGDSYVDSYVDATRHKFGDWAKTQAPTCTEKGAERRECENCDHYETREVEATGHDYEAVVTAPTCTEKGFTTHTCSKCADTYKDSYVEATGHAFGDWTVTIEPTCTETGEERRDCDNCDHFETREVEAMGHDYEAVVTVPTCTEKGFTTHTCSECGDSYVDSYVNAQGHEFQNGTCTNCGEPEVKYLRGDVDLDGDVDVDDVLALLWYVLFPEDYPIEVDADFDRNGSTDVDDVLTLLWYVLFPEEYPLN